MVEAEDSTDESEREEEEYEQLAARYGALIRSALPAVPHYNLDLEAPPHESRGGGSSCAQATGWPTSAPRRLYFCGFGPVLTSWDIYEFLAQFGPIEAFRLYTDPATNMSLRAAGVLYEDANDAARALEATSDGMVYLANVWAPEAQMVADPRGELARSQYEAAVHHPVPQLAPPPSDGRNGFGMSGRAAGGYGSANGGGANGKNHLHEHPAASASNGRCSQLFVCQLPHSVTALAVKDAFACFGFIRDFVGARIACFRSQCMVSRSCDLAVHSCAHACGCGCACAYACRVLHACMCDQGTRPDSEHDHSGDLEIKALPRPGRSKLWSKRGRTVLLGRATG